MTECFAGDPRPFDLDALASIAEIGRLDGERLQVIGQRLGITVGPPPTLEVAGDKLGVTRERVRQITAKIEKVWRNAPPDWPSLDLAIDYLATHAPISAAQVAESMVREGLSRSPVHPLGVARLAELTGRTVPWSVGADGRVFIEADVRAYESFTETLQRRVRPFGFSSVESAIEGLATVGIERTAAEIHAEVERLGGLRLEQGWFWLPVSQYGDHDYPVVVLLQLILVAAGNPVSVLDLRDGLRRRARFRQKTKYRPDLVPNRAVLLSFCDQRPEFNAIAGGKVDTALALDRDTLLTGTNRTMVDVLEAGGGLLGRKAFQEGCIESGMNRNTFSVYSTYSPVVAHLGTNVWAIRGRAVDPAGVAAVQDELASRPRTKRIIDYGWTPDGNVSITSRLSDDPALVVGIPRALRSYLADRRFTAVNETGSVVGAVGISAEGASWGYGPFLSRVGADEDDFLIAEFDLVSGEVMLRIDEDAAEEEGD